MSDRPEERDRREANEAKLVFARIKELNEQPIRGPFDLDHLRAVHAHIFQDLPQHRPGEVRSDTSGWSKNRTLENSVSIHEVHYAHEKIADRISATLRDLGGPAGLKGLGPDAFASRMATLYGDLDYAHGFYEGNSRTLREFSRSLALASGYELDWTPTNVTAVERNRLYIARDIAVLERAFPGLTPERGMLTNDRAEYEASLALPHMRRVPGASLETIIREGLHQSPALAAESAPTISKPGLGDRLFAELAERHRGDPSPSAPPTPVAGRQAGPEPGSVAAPAPPAQAAEPGPSQGPSYRSGPSPGP